MKKKLFVGLAAAALAAVMCVSFAACGESGGGGKAKSVKGEEVTEEQWDAAFEALKKDNAVFTLDYLEEVKVEASSGSQKGSTYTSSTISIIKNDAKEYYQNIDTAKNTGVMVEPGEKAETQEVIEEYAERVGTRYTIYDKTEAGTWDKSEGNDSVFSFGTVFTTKLGALKYADYEYSAENKGYILKTTGEDDHPFVIKFDKDGNLVAVYRSYESKLDTGVSKATTTYTFSIVISYTAKEIAMPTVA